MKQEEKAKAYDEAIERAKNYYSTTDSVADTELIELIFPELKESEDDRIRKEMISWLKGFIGEEEGCGYTEDEIRERIAWLEKQGEQKPAEKVEPKFKIGDWITNGIDVYKIKNIDLNEFNYIFENGISDISLVDNICHLWTIQDAKDGDVLVNQNGEMPFIFKECKNNHIYCYCGYTNRKDIFFNRFVDSEGDELHWLNLYHEQAYPATKEQRDLLFQKMHEAGYEWDADTKKMNKIEQKPTESKM